VAHYKIHYSEFRVISGMAKIRQQIRMGLGYIVAMTSRYDRLLSLSPPLEPDSRESTSTGHQFFLEGPVGLLVRLWLNAYDS